MQRRLLDTMSGLIIQGAHQQALTQSERNSTTGTHLEVRQPCEGLQGRNPRAGQTNSRALIWSCSRLRHWVPTTASMVSASMPASLSSWTVVMLRSRTQCARLRPRATRLGG